VKTKKSFSINFLSVISFATLVLTGCVGTSDIKPELPPPPRPLAKQSVNAPVVDYALQFQGAPYRYGSASPEEGFDCSGFVKYVYKHDGIELPRTVKEMASVLQPVPNESVRSGDLLFFNTAGDSFSHVGIFMNGTNFIHAPSSKTGKVTVSSLKSNYWRERFIDARRPMKH
jgi:cell wall-associated NlpC family hydrolase